MIFTTMWPIFGLICVGFLLARKGFPNAGFWPEAERINYFLLFPALLLSNAAKAQLRDPDILRLGAAGAITILAATMILYAVRKLRPMPAGRFGPMLQGVVRFNTYVSLAVLTASSGGAGLERAAVYLAVAVPLVNVLSILALTDKGQGHSYARMAVTMLRNPLIIACLVGLALAISGIGLPFGTDRFFGLLGQGSLPLGLLCVGAALQPAALGRDAVALTVASVVRLLAMPLLALGIATVFGLGEAETLVLIIFSAVPTAPTAYVLTRQMNGDGPLMAGIVTAQTLASVATVPLVLFAARMLVVGP